MRLVTCSDFDGLVCGALLKEAGIINQWKFAYPKDIQDGLVDVAEDDCLANVPYADGCGLWFDYHCNEYERNQLSGKYKGESRVTPSCARIIYEYYGGEERFPQFGELMEAVDKVNAGNLTADEILNPKGWILIGFLLDAKTGLFRWRDFTISNYQLVEKLMDECRIMTIDDILELPDIKERTQTYNAQNKKFKKMMKAHTRLEKDVTISDLRGVNPIYTSNRFMIYGIYPKQNIFACIVSGRGGTGCSVTVKYSVLHKTPNLNLEELMLKYGGCGHKTVGTCQFSDGDMVEKIPLLLEELLSNRKS